MKSFAACALSLGIWLSLAAAPITYQSNIIGFENHCVSQGVSRVCLHLDSFGPFPTIGKIIQFHPPEGIVGDKVEICLDGEKQVYRIAAYEDGRHRLESKISGVPPEITFDGIPLLDSFMLTHYGTNVVELTVSGEVAHPERFDPDLQFDEKRFNSLDVRFISPIDGCTKAVK